MNHFSEIIKAFNEQNPHFAIEENPEADVLRRMLREQRELIDKIKQQEKDRVENLKNLIKMYQKIEGYPMLKETLKQLLKYIKSEMEE